MILIGEACLAVYPLVLLALSDTKWAALVAELAPKDICGAYMGAFGSAPAIGFALAPLIDLQVRNSFGDDAMWTMFALLGVVAALLGGLALAASGVAWAASPLLY